MEHLLWLPWLFGTIATCGLLFAASCAPQVRRRGVSRHLISAGCLVMASAIITLLLSFVFPQDVMLHDTFPTFWSVELAGILLRSWLLQLPYCVALLIVTRTVLKSQHAPRGCDHSASGEGTALDKT